MSSDPTTVLAGELYELMLGDGATVATVRTKPRLMSLAYIRDEAPAVDGDAQQEAIAVTARELLEQATYALEEPISEREDKDADQGAAARCLLGLQPGTSSMSIHARRKHASDHAVKKVRSLTKRHSRRGRMVSYEEILMERLAEQLLAREIAFLAQRNAQIPWRNELHEDPFLARLYDVWAILRELGSLVEAIYSQPVVPPERPYPLHLDYCTLYLFAKLWTFVNRPSQQSVDLADSSDSVNELSPVGMLAALCRSSPFSLAEIERLTSLVIDEDSPTFPSEAGASWRLWLSCKCIDGQGTPCPVHVFCSALAAYTTAVEECWADLRDPHRNPSAVYRRNADPIDPVKAFKRYGIRPPRID